MVRSIKKESIDETIDKGYLMTYEKGSWEPGKHQLLHTHIDLGDFKSLTPEGLGEFIVRTDKHKKLKARGWRIHTYGSHKSGFEHTHITKESIDEVLRSADVKLIPTKLHDGRIVYRRQRKEVLVKDDYEVAAFSSPRPMVEPVDEPKHGKSDPLYQRVREALAGKRKKVCESIDEAFTAGIPDAPTARELGMRTKGAFAHHPSVRHMDENGVSHEIDEEATIRKIMLDHGLDRQTAERLFHSRY